MSFPVPFGFVSNECSRKSCCVKLSLFKAGFTSDGVGVGVGVVVGVIRELMT